VSPQVDEMEIVPDRAGLLGARDLNLACNMARWVPAGDRRANLRDPSGALNTVLPHATDGAV
jgi:hypothetical protein